MLFLRGGPVAPHSAWAGVGWWVNTVKDPVASAICHAAAIWQFCSKIPRPREIAAWGQPRQPARRVLRSRSRGLGQEGQDDAAHEAVCLPASQPIAQPAGHTAIHLDLGSAVAGEAAKVEADAGRQK